MPNQLRITTEQKQSSDRHNLREAVYLLSGTLRARSNVPDAPFFWSTREVTALGQTFEAYIAPPNGITRSMGFEPGSQGQMPAVRVPIRNLPFAHSESIVAAITDQDFRVENTIATLRVAYIRPGEDPNDIADADWTPLVLNGFLGPPEEVTLDGFILRVHNRGARRNLSLRWPQLPSPDTMSGGAIDRKDGGRMPPVIVGQPQGWIRVPSMNLGVRGFTASGFEAGDTEIVFDAITVGPEDLASGNVPDSGNKAGDGSYGTGTGRAGLMVHYLGPVYEVVSASLDESTRQFTVTLDSGLAASVPRGAFVQQWGPGYNPVSQEVLVTHPDGLAIDGTQVSWFWTKAGHRMGSDNSRYGWLFPDGEVRPADNSVWPFGSANTVLVDEGGQNLGGISGALEVDAAGAALSRGTRSSPNAPVYYDPLVDTASISQQPEFTTTVGTSLLNRGDGGSGVDNDKLRDGSEETGRAFAPGESVIIDFPDALPPYANSDTVKSVLHIVMSTSSANGIRFTNSGGGIEFAQITPPVTGVQKFAITQSAARNFNESVRVVAPTGGGGSVFEVWWEHELSAEVDNTRTQDVAVASGASLVGPAMRFAELVVNNAGDGSSLSSSAVSGGSVVQPDLTVIEGIAGVPYPTNVMLGLQMLLGDEGDMDLIDIPSYEAAHDRFVDENIRLNVVFTEDRRPRSWTELERIVGEQSRSFWFYAPSGHQVLFLETASTLEAATVQQSFRLPGCPGANTFPSAGSLMERTQTTELVNQVEAEWDPNYLDGKLRRLTRATNEQSIDEHGLRQSDRGSFPFSMHSPVEGNVNWDVAGQVSGIVQFYADRQAFAATRFTFDTAWIAHGLDRGSIIRISYPVTPLFFRNVVCEVERVSASPINNERFTITARSVGKPQKGIDANCTWIDAFDTDEAWTDVLFSQYDTWQDHWTASCDDGVALNQPESTPEGEALAATVPVSTQEDDTLSCTLPKPSTAIEGGRMLAAVAVKSVNNLPDLTVPSGWTEIVERSDGTTTLFVYEKEVGASEPDDYTWQGSGFDGFSSLTGVILGFSSQTAAVNVGLIATDTGTFSIPSVTNAEAGSTLVAFAATLMDTPTEAFTSSADLTQRAQHVGDASNEDPVASVVSTEGDLAAETISGRSFSNPDSSGSPLERVTVAMIVEF